MTPDVVVIGGGPAGLSAAIVLARAGIATLLCEAKETFPIDKACGEGLMPTCIADLRRLGISEAAVGANGVSFTGVRYVSPEGRVAQADFGEGRGVGLRRTVLSDLLVARAKRLPSLSLRFGASARLRERGNGAFDVHVGDEILSPRLVIGADGLSSLIRRQGHLAVEMRRPLRWGVREHFRVAPWTDRVEVHWAHGAEAYVTPIAPDCTNIAVLWDKERLSLHDGASGAFQQLIALFPTLARRLAGESPLSAPSASGPMHRIVRRPVRDGLLLIGDAAGYVDAITGEGVGLALRDSLLLDQYIVPLLVYRRADVVAATSMLRYVHASYAARRPNRALTRMLLKIRRHPALLERTIMALGTEPDVFRYLLNANIGCASLFGFPPGGAARFLMRVLAPHSLSASSAARVSA